MSPYGGASAGPSSGQNGYSSYPGHGPGSAGNGYDAGSADLHQKMCKKIAQLTKVIYALNTKADEHETIVEEIETKHEQQMTKFIADCQAKLLAAKTQVEDQHELKQKVQKLQSKISDLEETKRTQDADYEKVKRVAEEKIMTLKVDHSNVILGLSKELDEVRTDFKRRVQDFEENSERLIAERDKKLKEIRTLHGKELHNLEEKYQTQLSEALNRTEKDTEFQEKIADLEKKISAITLQRDTLQLKYNADIEKLSKESQNALEEMKEKCQLETMEATKRIRESFQKQMGSKELELQEQIEKLQSDIACNNEEIQKLNDEISRKDELLAKRQGSSEELGAQYEILSQQLSNSQTQLEDLNEQVSRHMVTIKENNSRIDQLEGEIEDQRKTGIEWEMKYQEILIEKGVFEDKNRWLETENQGLVDSNESLLKQMNDDSAKWQQVLTDMKSSMTKAEENHYQEITDLKEGHKQDIERLNLDFEDKLSKEKSLHETEMNEFLSKNTALMDWKKEFENKLAASEANFEKERKVFEEQLRKLQEESNSKLKFSQDKASELTNNLQQETSKCARLKNQVEKLENSLLNLEAEMRSKKSDYKNLEESFHQDKSKWAEVEENFRKEMLDLKQKHGQALIVLEANISSKWQEKLNNELEKMSKSLSSENNKQLSDELSKAEKNKQNELAVERKIFEEKIKQLNLKLAETEKLVEEAKRNARLGLEDVETRMANAKQAHESEVESLKSSFEKQLEELREKMNSEMLEQTVNSNQLIQELEVKLNQEHKVEIEKLQGQNAKDLVQKMEALKNKHSEETAALIEKHQAFLEQNKNDSVEKHMSEIQKITEGFKRQVDHLKQELSKSEDMKRKLDNDNQAKINSLKEEVLHRNVLIGSLEKDLAEKGEKLLRINSELEFKDRTVQKMRVESEENVRRKESEIEEKYRIEFDQLQADKIREHQKLLQEFSRTRDNFQSEIQYFKQKLKDAEEKYEQRESRPEDLEQITRDQNLISEMEDKMKRLVQEKEYFQRELVNRETNFNKVFSSSPNVGVLNPFNKPKTTFGTTQNGKGPILATNSSSQLMTKVSTPPRGRLEPLPNTSSTQNMRTPTPPRVPKRFL